MPAPSFQLLILLLLLALGGVSLWIFTQLSHQHTGGRLWTQFRTWAVEKGMKLRRFPANVDLGLLAPLAERRLRIWWKLHDTTTRLMLFQTQAAGTEAPVETWHVLIRELPATSAPVGLRPMKPTHSILDLFHMPTVATSASNVRFTAVGFDAHRVQKLSLSSARALLPPDIGLMISGGELLLDFSARPFDPIEFTRVIALADQLVKTSL